MSIVSKARTPVISYLKDIHIIDLNGISEGDEVHQHTDKNFKIPNVAENRKKKSFEDCEDESQQ